MMFKTNPMQQRLYLLDSQFSVRCRKGKQFTAGELFRRATFVNVYVGCIRSDHRLIGFRNGLQTENIASRTAKYKINCDILTQVFLKLRYRGRGVRVIPISNDVALIRGSNG